MSEPDRLPTLDRPVNFLTSFAYYRRAPLSEYRAGGLRVVADSGAYSAHHLGMVINVDEYAEWLARWQHDVAWAASLDDRPNEVEHCWRNYHRMRHKHGLDVVPTIHAGDPPSTLDRYAADGVDFVGLGGLVPHTGRPKATMPWVVAVLRYARDRHPTMRFHAWGVTGHRLLGVLPLFSADSSGIGAGFRYGVLPLFDPRSGRFVQLRLSGRTARAHHELLTRVYGLRSAADCLASTAGNRTMWLRLGVRSMQLQQANLRARHGPITSPSYAVRDEQPGVQLFAVDAAPQHAHRLMRADHAGADVPS